MTENQRRFQDAKSQSACEEEQQEKKNLIVKKLQDQGYRITKQRLLLIDIILSNECSCCKEIYYQASKHDSDIGAATVYRFVNTLEEIGAINRRNMYKVAYEA